MKTRGRKPEVREWNSEMSKENYRGFRDLIAYQKSYKVALEIFELTKTFPKEEQYSLTDQIRR